MKQIQYILLFFFTCLTAAAQRSVINFNKDWQFFLRYDSALKKTGRIEKDWHMVDLPHDWSIEGPFSEKSPATIQGGALPGGEARYLKTFSVPESSKDKIVSIEFDGIYRNSEVRINGHSLGKRPNGYISFGYDLTGYLHYGKELNEFYVTVDNTQQPNSRWYSGSGIYRNVRLVTTNKIAVAQWGTSIHTLIPDKTGALVNIKTTILNRLGKPTPVNIFTEVYDAMGELVYSDEGRHKKPFRLTDSLTDYSSAVNINKPKLWSTENPYLYKAVIKIKKNNNLIDTYTTSFGIRYFNFDSAKGFSLNGKHTKILGVCMHHDLGALGAAVNKAAIRRQLTILKEMGCNAIRTAHNPPAPELLDLCDEMGFIVMDEAFDMWKKKKNKFDYSADFTAWHKKDLEDQVKRDRNHPSVFMWSIGNEIREQFDSSGINLAKELVAIVKSIDTTRPVTCALSESDPGKNFIYQSGALDLVGLNYHQEVYADFPKNYPGQKFIASENMSALATRGHYDMPSDSVRYWPQSSRQKFVENGNADYTVSSYDNVAAYWGSTHEETWKIVKQHDFISGLFVWTGFDYLGEPTPYPWPARSSYFGIVDLAGFPKDVYYMYQSEWTKKPVLHIFPHWNWDAAKTVDVWSYYNNADEVELFLNGRSLGSKRKEGSNLHIMWRVPFEPGTLKAVSRKNGRIVLTKELKTAGEPAAIKISTDRKIIHHGGEDLCFITVKIMDAKGNPVPTASNLVNFSIQGAGTIEAVDNGYQASIEPFKASYRKAYNGMCLVVIRSAPRTGAIKLTASGDGLKPASITINCL